MEKRTSMLAVLLLAGIMAFGQGSVKALGGASDAAQRVFDGRQTPPGTVLELNAVEVQPEFPGGLAEMYSFLHKESHYPDAAFKDGVEGKVFVRFTVGSDGRVCDAEVLRGVRTDLDNEALRSIRAMPRWQPGTIDGKPVATRMVVPMDFKLMRKAAPSED